MLNKDHAGVLFAHVCKDHALSSSYGAAETADSLIPRSPVEQMRSYMSEKQAMLVNNTSGTPMRYIVGIYRYIPCIFHVYVRRRYMYAYTTYIQWISKFRFHVFMRISMLHTNVMVEDNIMLKPELY